MLKKSSEHKVQWNKYRAWGGKDAVMNMRFDDWWEEHWKDCFGIDEENQANIKSTRIQKQMN